MYASPSLPLSAVHGNLDLTGRSGLIASPLYPSPYAQNGDFVWRVTVEVGKLIAITVKELSTDRISDECAQVYLEVSAVVRNKSGNLG